MTPHPYDPEKARSLLQVAGQVGMQLDFPSVPATSLLTEAIAGQLKKVGFNVKTTVMDLAAIENKYQNRAPVMANPPLNAIRVYPLQNRVFPLGFFTTVFGLDGQLPTARDPKLDALIKDLGKAKDTEEYATKVGPIQEYIDKEFVAVPLFKTDDLYAANPRKIQQKWNAGGKTNHDPGLRELVSRGK